MPVGQLAFLILAVSVVSIFFVTLLSVAAFEQFGSAKHDAKRRSRNAAVVHEALRRADAA